jgi:hypothetical protein
MSAFAQYGSAATSMPPILLSCAAEIRDCSDKNGKLTGSPDWENISANDSRIKSHPFFRKTLDYRHRDSEAAPAPTTNQPHPAPHEGAQEAAPALTPPLVGASEKHNLFVSSTRPSDKKRKATSPQRDYKAKPGEWSEERRRELVLGRAPPKSHSRPPAKKVKSKENISDEDAEEVQAKGTIVVKVSLGAAALYCPQADSGLQRKDRAKVSGHAATNAAISTDPTVCASVFFLRHTNTTAQPGASLFTPNESSSERIHRVQCERCIKDDVPCIVMLGKKNGEVRKCCRNCDEKKTKCVRPGTDRAEFLRAGVVLKKAKAAAAAERMSPAPLSKSRARSRPPATRASSRRRPSPVLETLYKDADRVADSDIGKR